MKVSKNWAMGLLAMGAVAAFSVVALAQDGPITAEQQALNEAADMTVMKYIEFGGWVGNLLILVSVIMVALMIEHSVNIRRDKIVPPEVIDELEALLQEQEYQEALELCESEKNFVTAMVGAALAKMNLGFDEMHDAAAKAAAGQISKLRQHISYIDLIANLGPMLGLFGTVYGMIGAFSEIVRLGPSVTPKDLAGGVQQALVTTVDGLLVAMPAIVFGFWMKNKLGAITDELSAVGFDLIERFRTQGQAA